MIDDIIFNTFRYQCSRLENILRNDFRDDDRNHTIYFSSEIYAINSLCERVHTPSILRAGNEGDFHNFIIGHNR